MTSPPLPDLEFFFDVVSPYSYLAATQLQTLGGFSRAKVRWRPFFLGGAFKAAGNEMPARIPAKARYMLVDLDRWAKEYGVELRFPSVFPRNTIRAQRALTAVALEDAGGVPAFALALFRAYWVDDLDVTDGDVLRTHADQVGLDGARIVAATEYDAVKDALRATTDEAVARGAFGAPTFFLGDEMFWGNDRLHFVESALRALEGEK